MPICLVGQLTWSKNKFDKGNVALQPTAFVVSGKSNLRRLVLFVFPVLGKRFKYKTVGNYRFVSFRVFQTSFWFCLFELKHLQHLATKRKEFYLQVIKEYIYLKVYFSEGKVRWKISRSLKATKWLETFVKGSIWANEGRKPSSSSSHAHHRCTWRPSPSYKAKSGRQNTCFFSWIHSQGVTSGKQLLFLCYLRCAYVTTCETDWKTVGGGEYIHHYINLKHMVSWRSH